jgi:hypothetical protein
VFAVVEPDRLPGWVPGLHVITPVSFVLASELTYWSGWPDLRQALPLTLLGVPLFVALWRTDRTVPLGTELRRGAWLVAHLLLLTALSGLGSFKGANLVPAPYDTIAVALASLAVFPLAVRAGVRLHQEPAVTP